jgi:hypothetical protein
MGKWAGESLLPGLCRKGTVGSSELEARRRPYPPRMTTHSPFRDFKTAPEIIRITVMMYVRFPLSLRNVEDLLHEGGIEVCHETVRYWWNRFGPMFARRFAETGSIACAL